MTVTEQLDAFTAAYITAALMTVSKAPSPELLYTFIALAEDKARSRVSRGFTTPWGSPVSFDTFRPSH